MRAMQSPLDHEDKAHRLTSIAIPRLPSWSVAGPSYRAESLSEIEVGVVVYLAFETVPSTNLSLKQPT
jgi:hypothetical protein